MGWRITQPGYNATDYELCLGWRAGKKQPQWVAKSCCLVTEKQGQTITDVKPSVVCGGADAGCIQILLFTLPSVCLVFKQETTRIVHSSWKCIDVTWVRPFFKGPLLQQKEETSDRDGARLKIERLKANTFYQTQSTSLCLTVVFFSKAGPNFQWQW